MNAVQKDRGQPIRFDGKVAIVTGAGGGLGRAYAIALAKRGAHVIVNDLARKPGPGPEQSTSNPADKVAEEISAFGGSAIAVSGSVTDEKAMYQLADTARQEFGRIDIFIANAGIVRDSSFAKLDFDDFALVHDIHLLGAVRGIKAVWPTMVDQGFGRIIVTTSGAGLYGNFGQSNYASAKLGLIGLMNTLKIEGQKFGIKVNAIAPGAATPMTDNIIPESFHKKMSTDFVVPGIVFLCADDAPDGVILNASGGIFNISKIVETVGVDLSADCSPESLRHRWNEVSNAQGARSYASVAEQGAKLYARIGAAIGADQ